MIVDVWTVRLKWNSSGILIPEDWIQFDWLNAEIKLEFILKLADLLAEVEFAVELIKLNFNSCESAMNFSSVY